MKVQIGLLGTHRDDVAFDQASCYQLRVLSAFAGGKGNAIKPALRVAAVVCAEALHFLPWKNGSSRSWRATPQRTGDEARTTEAASRTVVVGYQEPPALPVNIGRRR